MQTDVDTAVKILSLQNLLSEIAEDRNQLQNGLIDSFSGHTDINVSIGLELNNLMNIW